MLNIFRKEKAYIKVEEASYPVIKKFKYPLEHPEDTNLTVLFIKKNEGIVLNCLNNCKHSGCIGKGYVSFNEHAFEPCDEVFEISNKGIVKS